MAIKMKTAFLALAFAGAASLTGIAFAAGGGSDYKMEHKHWHFSGPFGTYDRPAMQRGYQVYREVCSSCHQLEHMSFRHLGDKGAPFYDEHFPNPNDNQLVKNFAADWEIEYIDPDSGDVETRTGIPADGFPSPYANDAAARAANGGAFPPDLSVITLARTNGPDYVYNLLTAYGKEIPHDMEDKIGAGQHYNPMMDGGAIAMAPPLSDELIEYADGTPATVEQMAADVTEFLTWAGDPKMEQRKSTGLMVMVFLLVLTILTFLAYKQVWRDVDH